VRVALRIRKNGRVLCAAIHLKEPGDTYIDDTLHYEMSAKHKVLVTEEYEQHQHRGEWWWSGNVPAGIVIAEYYLKKGGVCAKYRI